MKYLACIGLDFEHQQEDASRLISNVAGKGNSDEADGKQLQIGHFWLPRIARFYSPSTSITTSVHDDHNPLFCITVQEPQFVSALHESTIRKIWTRSCRLSARLGLQLILQFWTTFTPSRISPVYSPRTTSMQRFSDLADNSACRFGQQTTLRPPADTSQAVLLNCLALHEKGRNNARHEMRWAVA